MIKAEILADSKNEYGNRITTMLVTFPRRILAEFNTHRMFSRNSASSRAIPFPKMVESVKNNPFMPIAWQKNHTGMQGTEYLSDRDVQVCKSAYIVGRDMAVRQAEHLFERGLTKQECNRLLEPYAWHTCIVTATEWENFFALRCPRYTTGYKVGSPEESDVKYHRSWRDLVRYYMNDLKANRDVIEELEREPLLDRLKTNKGQAEIHMMALAEAMWDAYNESNPRELKAGEWHIPFEDKIDYGKFNEVIDLQSTQSKTPQEVAVMISTIMCARVSYTTLDSEQSEWTYEKYIQKHDELMNASPMHASPFEHCARAMTDIEYRQSISGRINGDSPYSVDEKYQGWSGNFRGFIQYRKIIPNENITK